MLTRSERLEWLNSHRNLWQDRLINSHNQEFIKTGFVQVKWLKEPFLTELAKRAIQEKVWTSPMSEVKNFINAGIWRLYKKELADELTEIGVSELL